MQDMPNGRAQRESTHRPQGGSAARLGRGRGNWRSRLTESTAALRRHDPSREIILRRSRFTDLARRLATHPPQLFGTAQKRFEQAKKILTVLGPHATLLRGYSMTMDAEGNLIRSVTRVRRGDRLRTRVVDGTIESDAT